jgi:hypothetical protein
MKKTYCIAKSEKDCRYYVAAAVGPYLVCQSNDYKQGTCGIGRGVSKAARDKAIAGKTQNLSI